MATKPFSLLDTANVKKIRAAAQAGRKKVELAGRTFRLGRHVVNARYIVTTKPSINQDEKVTKSVKRKETWITVKPERGTLPCASIELKPLANLRSAVNGH